MRIGSLCSGYEGLGMAVQTLAPDAELAWVSDIDKGANKILAHRYPDVPNLGDFTVMDWSTVTPIDVLTAGYPCQPFSHAGKRAGTNDARHLWPEVLRCLTELRPPFALFENVRGHLSLGFDQVLADLATHDYDARWIVLRAADIGAPHGRARLFILAADARRGGDRWDLVGAGRGAVRVGGVRGEGPERGDAEGRADLLGGMTLLKTPTAQLAINGGSQHPDKRKAGGHGPTLADEVEHLLPTRANLHNEVAKMLPTPTSRDWKDHTIRREPHRPDDTDTLARALTDVPCATAKLLPTPKATNNENRPSPGFDNDGEVFYYIMREDRWGDYAAAIHRWEQILGRPAPAPTMTSAKGNPQLSPRFVEWMMGLPEGWVDDVPGLTRNEKLKALGNGVVSQQAVEAVLRLLALGSEVAA